MTSSAPKLRQFTGFVAFIDLIGFSELMRSRNPINKLNDVIDAIADRIEVANRKTPQINYIFISDSIIMFCETEHFAALAWKICEIQTVVLQKGTLTRGALAHGNIYLSADRALEDKRTGLGGGINIFGNAYMDAYELHTRAAKYPRVLISDEAIKIAKQDDLNKPVIKYLMGVDHDGWNIIYQFGRQLYYDVFYPNKNSEWPKKSLTTLTRIINSNCQKWSNDAHKREKWMWIKEHLDEQKRSIKSLIETN